MRIFTTAEVTNVVRNVDRLRKYTAHDILCFRLMLENTDFDLWGTDKCCTLTGMLRDTYMKNYLVGVGMMNAMMLESL